MNQSKKAISCAAIVAGIIAMAAALYMDFMRTGTSFRGGHFNRRSGIAYCRVLPAANEETPFKLFMYYSYSTAVCICRNCAYIRLPVVSFTP